MNGTTLGKESGILAVQIVKLQLKLRLRKMLEQVPFTRLKYFDDFRALTKRMGFPVRHYSLYSKNPPKKENKKPIKNATYFPKYSNYLFKNSNLSPF